MDDEEAYILLLLSDGNLPTGSFVASAGFESYVTHGFLSVLGTSGPNAKLQATTDFIEDSLSTYARSALPFVSDAHSIIEQHLSSSENDLKSTLSKLLALDDLYEAMTLNHVARRASQSQGVALLTLYSKGFSRPPTSDDAPDTRETAASELIDAFKLTIRREETPGHLPVCWGVLTASLGLSLDRSQFLHLFLHARSLLSAAVRMNTIGPYAAQQLLLHSVRPLANEAVNRCRGLRTGLRTVPESDCDGIQELFDEDMLTSNGPAMTWPLGEILAARHDLQHSRIFNS
ncbi:urease accessory protein UreF [Panus rudis PR-1116 ss-1]|nr:urease accessory protein UreF [Panus rudis PR-1116 ss-1]